MPYKTLAVIAAALFASPLLAQDAAVQAAAQAASGRVGYAASAFQSPTGAGSSNGNVGIGLYGQTVDNGGGSGSNMDGSLGLNIGMGDPVDQLGVDFAASFSSLLGSGSSDTFGEAGSFGAKIHRNFPKYVSVAIGAQSFGAWGDARDFNQPSGYVAVSKFFLLERTGLSATIGSGSRSYAVTGKGLGVFGALAWYITPGVSVIADYSGRFANLAVSMAPVSSWPVTVSLAAVNLNDRFGIGTQFAGTISYGFHL